METKELVLTSQLTETDSFWKQTEIKCDFWLFINAPENEYERKTEINMCILE